MKRFLCCLLCGCMTLGLLSGCGNNKDEGTKETGDKKGTGKQETQGDAETVVIWHDGDEGIMDTIAHCVNEELKDENIQVTFEKKSGLTDQLQLYGNDEANGPDMYFYAHDS